MAKNSFYNHIYFYVEVTNALKVVDVKVLRHRPYDRKTTQKWNLKHSPTNERVFHKSRLIALFFAFTVVSHLNNTHPTHLSFPFTSFKNVRTIAFRLG